ncbi:helix-turn-helix domain-containing protein [Streptomyces sp. NPDC057020]|uniref:helix-turn-helix domain-containing protein n=1 Tax=unclassified Streptomyces TaxID=2593676 RepID=UPI003625BF6A
MPRPCDDSAAQRPFAALAEHLRGLRRAARLPQRGLAERAHVSRGAVQRLESGTTATSMDVLDACLRACGASAADQAKARRLFVRGRTARRGRLSKLPKLKVPLDLIQTKRELCLALAAAYERAGAPCLSDARLTIGRKPLPRTTAWRIVNGKGLPTSTEQLITFLTACGIRPATQHKYFEAYVHVVAQRGSRRLPPETRPTTLLRPVRPVPAARGVSSFDITPLARALTAFADSLPRTDPAALAPGLAVLADRMAPVGRLVNREAQRNGAALPAWTAALSHFVKLNRIVADNASATGDDIIVRIGDGDIQLCQVKSSRGRPGPPPAGTPIPRPTRPAPAALAG